MPDFIFEWILGSVESYFDQHLVEIEGSLFLPLDFIEGFILELIPFFSRVVQACLWTGIISGLMACLFCLSFGYLSKCLDALLERRKKRKSPAPAVDE